MLDLKILLTKILQKLTFTPALLYSTRTECTAVGTTFENTTVSDIAGYNVIAVQFTVHEVSDLLIFFRGEDVDRSLVDVPAVGRFRGTIKVDWTNSQIQIRCVAAGNNRYDLVYFKNVYGIA